LINKQKKPDFVYSKNRIILSVVFLSIAASIGVYSLYSWNVIPRLFEKIEFKENDIIISKRYRYKYKKSYPVSIQQIPVSDISTNIIAVIKRDNKELDYKIKDNNLIIMFENPIKRGQIVDYTVKYYADNYSPFFNVVRHNGNLFTLHYINWDATPAIKVKTIELPEKAQITDVLSTVHNYFIKNNKAKFSGRFRRLKKFDISINFMLPTEETIRYVEASPPIIDNTNVTIRLPKAIYQSPPYIRGDFTGWKELPMKESNNFYIFKTNMPPGAYRYQVYYHIPHSDNSVIKRQFSHFEDSMSIIYVGTPGTFR